MAEAGRIPLRARAVFTALALLALALTVVRVPCSLPAPGWWLAALAVPVLARYPLVVLRHASGYEIGLDPVVVLFLAFAEPRHAALLWALSTTVAQGTTERGPWVRCFNAADSVLAGLAALAVAHLCDPGANPSGVLGVVTAALAGTTYYAVDYALSAVAVAVLGRAPLRSALWDETAPVMLASAGGCASLGYLGALVLHQDAAAFPLVLVPLVTVVYAGHAFSGVEDERLRFQALFTAARAQHAARDSREVLASAVEAGEHALGNSDVRIVSERPDGGIASPLGQGGPWLAASPKGTATRVYQDDDVDVLDLLATLTGDSLSRLALVSELEQLATVDGLTGLANGAALARALREAGPGAAVLFIDLDGFKAVNDEHGHDAGDALLRAVAHRLRRSVRTGDLVARPGGDEFVVLLPEADGPTAEGLAARVVTDLARPVSVGGSTVAVGASVGVAVGGGDLVRRADIAMYAAKRAGKDRYARCTDEMHRQHMEARDLPEQLRGAGERGELVLHYQPIVDLALGRVDGVEALIRWQHPTRGLLAPDAFIPQAEESGVVDELTAWVLQRAVADGAALHAAAGRQVSISINVPAAALVRGVLLDELRHGSREDVQLILEVTETTLAEPAAVPVLEEFRRRGVRIALDDFGTGHSSLAALRLLPVDIIKLDRAFTADLPGDPRAGHLIRSVGSLASALDKPLVVEGIEGADQLAELQRLGVVLGQGFLLARPAPLAQVLPLVAPGATVRGLRQPPLTASSASAPSPAQVP
ncbi:diguanylate cyclase (GGDEF)-like protein [Motilibacter rhizosphaerae]|uniref:Diguanylate cyclase (GGDEF)-like protein n=1 Tax=Motilibacter rhizosphaerae TaxID=598652 RepID=A0A4Q7NRM0_9ACTN|nr:EAL domain-containing protein [Motilibacter rhizosphaerae]RZS89701.1 diguanylate cyclase (GGDEF)-like protein [Motilibacter rhizosphaerae]